MTCVEGCNCHYNCQNSHIVVEENKRIFRIENPNKRSIDQIQVDGCKIRDNSIRCDYLFIDVDTKKKIFVELKGKGVDHAVKQIVETVKKLAPSELCKASIICSSSPVGTSAQRFIKLLKKQNVLLTIRTRIHEETIEKLIQF